MGRRLGERRQEVGRDIAYLDVSEVLLCWVIGREVEGWDWGWSFKVLGCQLGSLFLFPDLWVVSCIVSH